jgi:hypothetical protein
MSNPTDDVTEKSTQERWDDLKMSDQIGIFADVTRTQVADDTAHRANRALNDIGDFIHKRRPELAGLQYLGSASVHIFLAPTLKEIKYITQVQPLLECPERIAGPAFTQLQKDMMASYGRKTTKIRSGF